MADQPGRRGRSRSLTLSGSAADENPRAARMPVPTTAAPTTEKSATNPMRAALDEHTGPRPDQPSDAVTRMESGHDATPDLFLETGGLDVHRHVDHPRSRSPGKQDREQLPGGVDHAQRSQQRAEGNAGQSHHPARRDPAEQVTRGGHSDDGAQRRSEQGQTERAVGQAQMCLHCGDPRRPYPGNQTEQKEDDDDRHVLPASLRRGRCLERESEDPRRDRAVHHTRSTMSPSASSWSVALGARR